MMVFLLVNETKEQRYIKCKFKETNSSCKAFDRDTIRVAQAKSSV